MQLCLYSGNLVVVKARALPCVFLYYGVGVGGPYSVTKTYSVIGFWF